jgi:L-ribulokinase
MPTMRAVVGVDFGSLSARAVVVDADTGDELGTGVAEYRHGVLDSHLGDRPLPPDWAIQVPDDYRAALEAAVRTSLGHGVSPDAVVGIAVDTTASSPLPTTADGTPLCELEAWAAEPHAYLKLWKHHAAAPEALAISGLARERNEPWLARYGGSYSAEWFFSKLLQILREAPACYAAIDRFVELSDWLVWQLTGREIRNACTAGYKMLRQDGHYPDRGFFGALHPEFAEVVGTRIGGQAVLPVGRRAGSLSARWAERLGLCEGIAVAAGNVDAHVTAAAVDGCRPGVMTMIMGTSVCHVVSSPALVAVEGICGVVDGGIVEGLWGYEAGQPCVGDMLGWFTEQATPAWCAAAAGAAGLDLHGWLEREAWAVPPGSNGLLALDWWNGNRSVLVDAELSGLLVGQTIGTRPPDIYRALLEATAFGTRMIIDTMAHAGIVIDELVAAGGLPERNRLLLQIVADVTGRPVAKAASAYAPAVGSAVHAAVAAGLYPDVPSAAAVIGGRQHEVITPDPVHRAIYDEVYQDYRQLHDYFGCMTDVMQRMRARAHATRRTADHDQGDST